MSNKKFENILKASKLEAIPFQPSGIASETDGYLISETGMDNIDAAFELNENLSADLAAASDKIAEKQQGIDALKSALAELQTQFDALQASSAKTADELATANKTIAEQKKQIEELGKLPGAKFSNAQSDEDPKNESAEDYNNFGFQQEILNRVKG